ncbi:hypothetical protein ALC57_14744 [Trachymyrmex cornetzi]|uniref:Uncharacterized protein n=1 Tax=Trachymyrmex cornetzi TaxID=471704 RepID=A0A195DJR5_9HYME|nr:hypothetical protein ALC57_14744 [Trachymyrmex cornetzi]
MTEDERGSKPKLKQPLIAKSVNSFHRVVPNPILRKASRKRIGRTQRSGDSPLMKGDDGVVGGVGERCGVGDGDGGGGSDDRRGDYWSSLQDRRGVGERSSGHKRTLHRHLVGVGVAGGDREGMGDRYRSRDYRRRVEGGRQVSGCTRDAGHQGEESDDLVHAD